MPPIHYTATLISNYIKLSVVKYHYSVEIILSLYQSINNSPIIVAFNTNIQIYLTI